MTEQFLLTPDIPSPVEELCPPPVSVLDTGADGLLFWSSSSIAPCSPDSLPRGASSGTIAGAKNGHCDGWNTVIITVAVSALLPSNRCDFNDSSRRSVRYHIFTFHAKAVERPDGAPSSARSTLEIIYCFQFSLGVHVFTADTPKQARTSFCMITILQSQHYS